ncbi:hypothetical protein VST7929_01037 [Vibrio stylophorae]|uniref:Lipoprotein n=1 Tax=Vibrio stylophorae TaxID=659351 RepID=A0ABM8ZS92_9VIBR|nr:hypothetical protein [Vibrio stylophorae]CAH0533175.1 hypothetical protein VST7929_01037 [Vibrio stylophorae]
MNMKVYLLLFFSIISTACVGSPYTYHVDPTPLKAGESQYVLGKVDVKLTLGEGAITGDKTFANQAQLEAEFRKDLTAAMKAQGILAEHPQSADGTLDIQVDYTRNFNNGGKSLNKPHVKHAFIIHHDNVSLVSMPYCGSYTTDFGSFAEVDANAQIASFEWNEKDEPRDIQLIAEKIIQDVVKVGD